MHLRVQFASKTQYPSHSIHVVTHAFANDAATVAYRNAPFAGKLSRPRSNYTSRETSGVRSAFPCVNAQLLRAHVLTRVALFLLHSKPAARSQ